ncbi:glycoside hydrolase family 3 C-terminal domain-containing protein [Bifidobacterium dentium]|uniref:glycoside hydrolase family 3 protein n=1 Tax=Bifidobacterium dentium TaxID=1689 RepID=UPI0018C3094A|nr:glycoside hydrolase family 3 protein [Bifidobacterium dentium]MBF9697166.1 glycoside hydrolase family 3 C-terminal domain-containing protein [Bifidobacterium dentium]MBF9713323.1 glycoside hydrolase family 3 C-terminal domain-containing protein [Bifidobacterium dentium]MBF9715286.1 glycoside hydrolase family 3 C-terminal domain-containing protein [Bifidobacterium dentium]MBF9719266.1 glycoside hydrolase family 3 C-terminal domain-containing protein [Bifidobacterium dentium]
MLEINMDDVIAVIQSITPQLIAVAVALVLGIIVTIAINKKTVTNQGMRKLVRSTSWVVVATAAIVSISMALTGPLNNMLTMATATKHELTQETIDKTNKLAVDIEREGITLLQNNDGMLPMNDAGNINVFGWASTNPIYGGTGSGALSDAYDTTTLLDGLHDAGFKTNEELTKFYTDYSTTRGVIAVTSADWTLPEPAAGTYADELIGNAKNFSDTAMVVIGRVGGEGLDLPTDMKADGVTYNDNSKDYEDFPKGTHYLELSQSEKDMIDLVTKNFEKVVLVYNGANAFELNFAKDYPQIKSVLWVPHPGQAGFEALGEVLAGKTNPSGRTADTFLTDLTANPTWNNFGNFEYNNVKEFEVDSARGVRFPHFVNYNEGIYVGYRYYETAADEGLIDYDSVVQYPFGYGLSYTSFDEKMGSVAYDTESGTISFDVTVTNTGDVAGKDVVEVYYNPPYTNGGIEKASANLVSFEKTKELEPGESETVSIEFDDDDMASYDYRNAKSYVLESGDYRISVRTDSHSIVDEKTVNVASTITYNSEDNTHNGDAIVATNVFDDANGGLNYLSRADHFANAKEALAGPVNYSMSDKDKSTFYNVGNYDPTKFDNDSDDMPTTGARNGLRLVDLRGVDYNDAKWDRLLDQLTFDDMDNLIANAGYQNAAIKSIGKVRLSDVDGPAALKDNFTGVSSIGLPSNIVLACSWNKDLAREYGETIGDMAHEMQVSGWYAPSVNLHRSPFAGRNFEYFSEDPTLSGDLSGEQVLGAADRGVYAFIKHFALNEQETQRNGQLCTWANEQSIRELYLKPFETVIKADGDAQAVMGSFNYIGNTYSSAHTGLNQTVLRGEWGFRGFVETDYFSGSNYSYQTADQAIRGGTDAMLATTETTNHITDHSATSVKAMRAATHNILYTAVNSWRYADGEPADPMPGWKVTMIVVDVVLGVTLVGLETLAIKRFLSRRKAAAAK